MLTASQPGLPGAEPGSRLPMTRPSEPLAALLEALVAGDFERLAGVFAPDVRFRAVLPGEVYEADTPAAAAAAFQDWFGDALELTPVSSGTDRLGVATVFVFRLRVRDARGSKLIQQSGAYELDGGKVRAMRLACTGFQVDSRGDTGRFDAGDLGCASGLPAAFREHIGGVEVGQVLGVIVRDPSGREDLPAMARMLGHRVLSVDDGDDGETLIRVERGR